MNKKARNEVLERDNQECQLSKMFGISHLSGVPCVEELEVHHITYERYGQEKTDDLITVCRRCHDFLTNYIRLLRFTHKNQHLKPDDSNDENSWPMVETEKIRNGDIDFQAGRIDTDANAQREISRSAGRIRQSINACIESEK